MVKWPLTAVLVMLLLELLVRLVHQLRQQTLQLLLLVSHLSIAHGPRAEIHLIIDHIAALVDLRRVMVPRARHARALHHEA